MVIIYVAIGTCIGVMLSYILSMTLVMNKHFMTWLTKKYLKIITEITTNMESENVEKEE